MSTLTQHQTVLHWYEDANEDWNHPGVVASVGQPQRFFPERPVPFAYRPGPALMLDYDTWQDMGAPIDITLTVTPGDHLNAKD